MMADPLHILNIGNTHVQLFESPDPGTLIPAGFFSTPDFDPAMVRQYLPRLAVSSVVPRLTAALRDAGAFVISGAMKLPFTPSPLDLTTVGADRIANAAALLDGPLPAISIDFGTAVDIEYVTADRQFSGGAILPGRSLLRNALHDHTAQLPMIPLSDELPALPGLNTADALRIGTDRAAVDAVRELIREWRQLCAPSPLRVVACGGDRNFFLKNINGMTDGGEHFTVRGIRKLWDWHHAGQDLRHSG